MPDAVAAAPTPVPVPVDILWSYARRVGDDVRVVLVLPPETPVDAARHWLRLEHDGEGFRTPAQLSRASAGWRVEALVPGDRLGPALWRLRLRVGQGGPLLRLQARLLIAPGQPVALLPGPRPSQKRPPTGGSNPY